LADGQRASLFVPCGLDSWNGTWNENENGSESAYGIDDAIDGEVTTNDVGT
jgi:hypothetical protein